MHLFLAVINTYLKEYFIPVILSACVTHQNWVLWSADGFGMPGGSDCWQGGSSSSSSCILSGWGHVTVPQAQPVRQETKARLGWILGELQSRGAPTQKRGAQIPSEHLDSQVLEQLSKTTCPHRTDTWHQTHRGKQVTNSSYFLGCPLGNNH